MFGAKRHQGPSMKHAGNGRREAKAVGPEMKMCEGNCRKRGTKIKEKDNEQRPRLQPAAANGDKKLTTRRRVAI